MIPPQKKQKTNNQPTLFMSVTKKQKEIAFCSLFSYKQTKKHFPIFTLIIFLERRENKKKQTKKKSTTTTTSQSEIY